MSVLFLTHPALGPFIKAICWTLIHSLWQGLVVAILGGIVIAITKRRKAAVRYPIFLGLFGLLLVVIGITFIGELRYAARSQDTFSVKRLEGTAVKLVSAQEPSTNNVDAPSFTGSVAGFLDRHASFIVLFWAVFFVIKLLQFSYGFSYMGRLKQSAVLPAEEWNSLISSLSKRLGLRHTPVLMKSSSIHVPVTFGFIKATILVPLSLLSTLPPNQVEAVLLHELAHIRRNDYLVNLVQNSAELFFFFNPALLWMSSLIRQERESCCDEIVLQHTAHKQTYLEALLSFQEYALSHGYPAMAIASNKNYLLRRVQRMLTNENQNLNSMEKTFLMLGITVIAAFGFTSATTEQKPIAQQITINEVIKKVTNPGIAEGVLGARALTSIAGKEQVEIAAITPGRDTVPKQKTKTNRYSNVTTKSSNDGQTKVYEVEATNTEGKTIRLKKLNDELTELEVDGKKLETTNSEFKDHLIEIEELEKNAGQELIEVQKIEHNILKEKMEVQKKQHQTSKQRMESQKKDFAKHQKDFKKHQDEFKKHHKELQEVKMKNIPKIEKMQMERDVMKKVMAIEKKNMLKEKEMNKRRVDFMERQKPYRESNDEVSSIINELSNRGLITNPNVLSFTLSNKELIVNGKKGPEDLHQSLVRKYIKKAGDHYSYTKSGGSISTTVNKE